MRFCNQVEAKGVWEAPSGICKGIFILFQIKNKRRKRKRRKRKKRKKKNKKKNK